ncbi:ABC transporter permease [Pelagimonas varians]|uniref:Dipeptide transport system permease protein DppB n=1 Tax=Pelagimonas varians TaxID=696760 RepID=A0A238L1F9_9RHOB|nr:ABC transporter permease [Pelagimonas varians]PYG26821.1 peptide/nickel transport system permease protein [Pelagimonas varians]SMX48827.1 Dipeptide transport system permease protein DppB [Pelagimonas varians]
MLNFLGKRAVASAISLVGLVLLVFFLSRLTGDPTGLYLPLDASEEARNQFREIHGLNDPLIVQFFSYMADLIRFDFGDSIRRSEPAIDVVMRGFAWTLQLTFVTMSLVVVFAVIFGSLAAFNVGGVFDRIATFFSLIGASAPDFWIAIVAIVIFSVKLGWFPTSGTGTVWHWVMPVSVLFIRPFGLILQIVRGAMITALGSAYVKTARAKGIKNRPIIFVHALRNALLPVITVIGDQAAALLNGAVVIESIFGFPGVGKLMIDSILQRDFTVVMAAIMVTAMAIFVMNLLIDILYSILDPRIRY